jgi:kynurenine formamidase
MPRLIDVSHPVGDGTVTYPGLPAPSITDYLSRDASRARYADGTTFQIGRVDMIANTGTYIDAPSHRWEDGADIADLALEKIADLEGLVVDGTHLRDQSFKGCAVLFRTGWSQHFGKPEYGRGHPFLTRETAEQLIAGGAALVGIDSLNIDDTADGTRPVHSRLLAAGIPIVEHLTALEKLPSRFRFFAVPAKFAGMGSFPVRAFAIA